VIARLGCPFYGQLSPCPVLDNAPSCYDPRMLRLLVVTLFTFVLLFAGQVQGPSKSPRQSHGQKIDRKQGEANENSTITSADQPPDTAKAQASPNPGDERTRTAPDNDRAKADWWLAAFTGALVFFTAALVFVSYLQYRTLRHHENWMQKNVEVVTEIARAATTSANTADASLKITEDGLRTSNEAAVANAKASQLHAQALINAERPWIIVSISPTLRNNFFAFQAANYGRTPAEIVSANVKWTVSLDEEGRDLPSPPDYGTNMLPYRKLLPSMQNPWEFSSEDVSNRLRGEPPAADLRQGRKWFMIYGCVRYNDMLDASQSHETRFCYRYDPASMQLFLSGPKDYNQRT
jgi:hypothetical protein